MKKLVLSLIVGLAIFACKEARADHYSAALSTFTVASNTTTFATLYPNITGAIEVTYVSLETASTCTGPSDAVFLVGVYDNCTSTTAATDDYYFSVVGSTATSESAHVSGSKSYTFPSSSPLRLTNPGFYLKSSPNLAAGSDTVYINVHYRKR